LLPLVTSRLVVAFYAKRPDFFQTFKMKLGIIEGVYVRCVARRIGTIQYGASRENTWANYVSCFLLFGSGKNLCRVIRGIVNSGDTQR